MWGWAFQNAGARVLASGYKVRIDDLRGVMPDAQLYLAGNTAQREENGLVRGHPDLVVEVLSSSSVGVDRVLKARWYGAIGTPEYWIVDPVARTVERYVLQGNKYLLADGATGDETFAPESLAGLEIPLARLFPPVATS